MRTPGEIAAILVEPVQFNIGVVPPRDGYLQRLRELADEHGIVLIFDEVKTGVVLAWGGAYEHFGVRPDLFCLAKSIGGGIPIGAFGGKREVMASIETLEGTPAFRCAMRRDPASTARPFPAAPLASHISGRSTETRSR